MANFFNMKLKPQTRKPLDNAVMVTGFGGAPSIRQLQAGSVSFALPRPETLMGYTGGWATFGNPTAQLLNNTSFGNPGPVSASHYPRGAMSVSMAK